MCIPYPIRWFSARLWVLAAVLLVTGGPAKADVEVFRVSGIPVDVTAESATTARENALAQGHFEAYRRLMARLVLEGDAAYVPNLGQGQIAQLVQDFSVANEKTSAVRYLADLTFRFKPDAVRDLFRNNRLRFTETRSKPVLVLPVLFADGRVLLWEDDNLWAFAWAERDLAEELVPLLIPLGDLGDVAAVDAQRALAGDGDALSDIALRYNTEGVLVVQAELSGEPEAGNARLDVTADRHDGSAWRIYAGSISQSVTGTRQTLYDQAIDAVIAAAQAEWKAANHLSFDDQRMLSAIVPVTELGDWLEVKKRLKDIASIVRMDLVFLTRQYAQVDIAFIGDEERLSRALEQRDLALSRSALAGWELRLSGAAGTGVIPLDAFEPLSQDQFESQSGNQLDELSGDQSVPLSETLTEPALELESQPEFPAQDLEGAPADGLTTTE